MEYKILSVDKKDDKIILTVELLEKEFRNTIAIDVNEISAVALAEIPINKLRADNIIK